MHEHDFFSFSFIKGYNLIRNSPSPLFKRVIRTKLENVVQIDTLCSFHL